MKNEIFRRTQNVHSTYTQVFEHLITGRTFCTFGQFYSPKKTCDQTNEYLTNKTYKCTAEI